MNTPTLSAKDADWQKKIIDNSAARDAYHFAKNITGALHKIRISNPD